MYLKGMFDMFEIGRKEKGGERREGIQGEKLEGGKRREGGEGKGWEGKEKLRGGRVWE